MAPLDIQTKNEFLYVLNERNHLGIHVQELTELSKLIAKDLLESMQCVKVGHKLYECFLSPEEYPVNEELRNLWEASVSLPL